MIGNPFCTIKVFLNFHTKIDWRRCAMRFLINWRESGLHRSLKKRYSKTIKDKKEFGSPLALQTERQSDS